MKPQNLKKKALKPQQHTRPAASGHKPPQTMHGAAGSPMSWFSAKQSPGRIWVWMLLLALVTFLTYIPTLKNGFTNWDDEEYVYHNPTINEISGSTIANMFSGPNKYFMGNYHPLTMLSLAIDQKIGKSAAIQSLGKSLRGKETIAHDPDFEPLIFHITNLVLHLVCTISVFWFLYLFWGNFWIAIAAALLFGINAMHVESVTWVSERKDVLYSAFFFLSLVTYAKYLKNNKMHYLALTFLLFILSCFSKGQAVSLAVTLVLLDLVKGRNLISKKVILEKIPFLVAAVIFGILAVRAQQAMNTILEIRMYPFYVRIANASYGFVEYLVKLFLPLTLSAVYPYPGFQVSSFPATFWLFTIPAAIVIYFFVRALLRKEMNMLFGMGFFIVNIVLLLQLIPVGDVIMADRYSYVPSAGFFFLIASGTGWAIHKKPQLKQVLVGVFLLYALIQCVLTFNQTKVWKDSLALWENTTKASPDSHVAWHNLGHALYNVDRKQEAVDCYTKALSINPDYHPSYKNRGSALRELGRVDEAIKDLNKAIALRFDNAMAWHSRGISYETKGDLVKAMSDINQAIRLNPNESLYYGSLARCYYRLGKSDSALIFYDKAIAMKPKGNELYANRGAAYTQAKKYDLAEKDFNLAISLNPENPTNFLNRGVLKNMLKDTKGALEDFEQALRLKPDFWDAFLQRATMRQNIGDKEGAIADYGKMIGIRPDNPSPYFEKVRLSVELGKTNTICNDINKGVSLGIKDLIPYQQKFCK